MLAQPPTRDVHFVDTLVADVTDEDLGRKCADQTVLTCLWTLFEEEWQHNWFANRDLDVLVRGSSSV